VCVVCSPLVRTASIGLLKYLQVRKAKENQVEVDTLMKVMMSISSGACQPLCTPIPIAWNQMSVVLMPLQAIYTMKLYFSFQIKINSNANMQELSTPLTRYTSGFPNPDKLHPFDAALLQLTVNTAMYKYVLLHVQSNKYCLYMLNAIAQYA
jgi:hypothetical protein